MLGPIQRGPDECVGLVQKKAAKFVNLTGDSNWKMSEKRRKTERICAVCTSYCGQSAWKAVGEGDRQQRPYYLSSVGDEWKIRKRRQRTPVGKYAFVNRTIQL